MSSSFQWRKSSNRERNTRGTRGTRGTRREQTSCASCASCVPFPSLPLCETISEMLNALVLAAVLIFGQKPEGTGRIAGIVIASPQQKISQPIQVILLSPRYINLWDSAVQRRLDFYWE